ncbi:MAG: DUF4926 domain-containing protein [Chitinophagales bacterium]
MQKQEIKLLDVVALLKDKQESKLSIGQVGTVVEILDKGIFEVEFSNKTGETIALVPLKEEELLLLHYEVEMV